MRVQAERAQAGSSVTAGSCNLVSEAPGRRAGNLDPGSPGCALHAAHGRFLHFLHGSPCCRGSFDVHLEFHLLRSQPCLSYLHRDLEERTKFQFSISWQCYRKSYLGIQEQLHAVSLHSPDVSPFTCPTYPGGGMGGITRLKGMGMFKDAIGPGPVPIIPIWSWVWKYILDVRPAMGRSTAT